MRGGRGCLPHTVQSLGHAFPALCRVHVGLNDVLLSLRPSLPGLRGRLLPFVRLVHRYYGTVRLLLYVHVRRSVYGLRGPVLVFSSKTCRRSPGSRACCFSACGFLDYVGPAIHSRLAWLSCCLPLSEWSRRPVPSAFRSSIARPTDTPVYASSDIS
jgi:hypothetical protein